jgi:predicted CopG family antitoxin
MRTLNVSISENEYKRLGLKDESLTFSELFNLVSTELLRQNLERSIELAEKYGLSNMTMDEITEEVKAVRTHAKSNN